MSKCHIYVVTCIKEGPLQWGIELEASDNPVPSKIVRFPNLTQPLTTTPHFQSDCDPITYFKQLVKGIPEMLREYHARVFRQIQGRMNQLEVGECCHVRISYIDSRGGISPYKYNIELIEPSLRESHPNRSDQTESKHAENVGVPSAAPSIDNLYPSFMDEIGWDCEESDALPSGERSVASINNDINPLELITQLHEEIQELQGDLDRIKDRIAEAVVPACQSLGQQAATSSPDSMACTETEALEAAVLNPPVTGNGQHKEILLNLDEQCAIEYIVNQQVVTESQLRDVCHISNPVDVMNHLIEKMEQCDFSWISTEESQGGESIYTWNAPE